MGEENYWLFIDNSNRGNYVIALRNCPHAPETKVVGELKLEDINRNYKFKIKGEYADIIKEYLDILKKNEFKDSKKITSSKKILINLAKKLYYEHRLPD